MRVQFMEPNYLSNLSSAVDKGTHAILVNCRLRLTINTNLFNHRQRRDALGKLPTNLSVMMTKAKSNVK
jgi:hypothetical protein